MTTPTGGGDFLRDLEAEVSEELTVAEYSSTEEAVVEPVSEWLYDPTDAERQRTALHDLLSAIQKLEVGPESGDEGG